jgi:hypothetical protein
MVAIFRGMKERQRKKLTSSLAGGALAAMNSDAHDLVSARVEQGVREALGHDVLW